VKFLLDQNLIPGLARGMAAFGEGVTQLTDHFAPDTEDVEWPRIIGERGWFLVTRDEAIRFHPAEREAFRRYDVGAFLLGGENRSRWELVEQLVRNRTAMREYAGRTRRPFMAKVVSSAVRSNRGTSEKPIAKRSGAGPLAKTKTSPTGASVEAYLESRASPEQMKDCRAIMAMCERVTRQPPHMWGPSIVGFGSYTYRYASGHSGDAPLAAFAIRGRELVVYLGVDDPGQTELLAQLGKHRMGKSCLYFKRLADLDATVLEALVALSVAEARPRHGESQSGA
jgi:hypothetical protein